MQDKLGYIDNQDNAKETIRESTSHNIALNANMQDKLGYIDNKDKAKETLRQTTSHNTVLNANAQDKLGYIDNKDKAKPTIKQSTLVATPAANINNMNMGNYIKDVYDIAKTTVRQQTINNKYVGHLNNRNEGNYATIQDEVKPTIKQTTLAATPAANINNMNMGSYTLDDNDIARPTIKQTTLLRDYTGGLAAEVNKHISSTAANNMEIDERREITTYNRAANGRGDLNGPYIDKDNVKLNEPIHFSYIPGPLIRLDNSIMPRVTRDIIENVYAKSKPIVETSSYYVNENFINTLKNNPLVNDIYHQKNV